MTEEVTTISPEQSVGALVNLFAEVSYHHLPVVDAGKLVGIVSDRDVSQSVNVNLENEESLLLLKRPTKDIMTPSPVVVDRSTSVECASILLLEHDISCLPVVNDEDEVEGLLTWKDILRFHVYVN